MMFVKIIIVIVAAIGYVFLRNFLFKKYKPQENYLYDIYNMPLATFLASLGYFSGLPLVSVFAAGWLISAILTLISSAVMGIYLFLKRFYKTIYQ